MGPKENQHFLAGQMPQGRPLRFPQVMQVEVERHIRLWVRGSAVTGVRETSSTGKKHSSEHRDAVSAS